MTAPRAAGERLHEVGIDGKRESAREADTQLLARTAGAKRPRSGRGSG